METSPNTIYSINKYRDSNPNLLLKGSMSLQLGPTHVGNHVQELKKLESLIGTKYHTRGV